MNLKDSNVCHDFDVLCQNEEVYMSLKTSSSAEQQQEEQHIGENSSSTSCRKRPPGGSSMYSNVTATISTSTTTTASSFYPSASSLTSSSFLQDDQASFNMNGTREKQWKSNSTSTTTRNNIGSHKRKLQDVGVSSANEKELEKPLGRSDVMVVSDNNIDGKKKQLLTLQQIPTHLRFNRFVLSHYRAPTDCRGCINSLGYMHNETINILTHAIPLVCIMASIPWFLPYESITIPYLPTFHVVASLAPWVGSILYHLFMNHEKGYSVYEAVLTIDLIGIWTTQTTGGLITICATIYCFDNELQEQLLTAYGFLCLYCLYKAMTANGPWDRRFAFTAPFMVRMSMVLLRALGKGGGNQDSFIHVILQDLVAVAGAIIGATNIPERWFPPGALDLFCNSHHVMHVLVVYAVYHMHSAAVLDLTWMSEIQQNKLTCSSESTALPSFNELFGGYL